MTILVGLASGTQLVLHGVTTAELATYLNVLYQCCGTVDMVDHNGGSPEPTYKVCTSRIEFIRQN